MHMSDTIILIMAMLGFGVLASGIWAKSKVPYTVILVLIGMVFGELSRSTAALSEFAEFKLSPEIVLFVFLPVLIFESGLKLNSRLLFKNLAPVLMMAVPALFISTALIGLGIWWLLPVELPTALVFGALISATDPVAVIAIFKELGTPERLTTLVEGESLANDASAIVLFNILLGVALYPDADISTLSAVGEFIKVFMGGLLIGTVSGWLLSLLLTRLPFSGAAIMSLSMILAYGLFIGVEHHLHLSGVMAVAAAAVVLGAFATPKLKQSQNQALDESWEFLVLLANTLLFLLIGMSIQLESLAGAFSGIIGAILLVLIARATVIYSLVPFTARFLGGPKISLDYQHIMWWGGLKGGLALAIVLSIPDSMPDKALLLNLTIGVVMFTLLVNAPSIRALIAWRGINQLTEQEQRELDESKTRLTHQARELLSSFQKAGVLSKPSRKLLNKKYQAILKTSGEEVKKVDEYIYLRLQLLRQEKESLGQLFQQGIIQQYTYLELKGEIQRKRHSLITQNPEQYLGKKQAFSHFLKIEHLLIAWLRERDFATAILAWYQNARISQHLKKDIAAIFMAQHALSYLVRQDYLAKSLIERAEKSYLRRLNNLRERVQQVRINAPEYYHRFEQRLSYQAVLSSALDTLDNDLHHGVVGAKVYTQIRQIIENTLATIPPITNPVPELDKVALLNMVPLFDGLPVETLRHIADQADSVSFLSEDIVVGEGDSGDSLYIIAQGHFAVYKMDQEEEKQVAVLLPGEFFGEIALLQDSVRTATVKALQEGNVIRLVRNKVVEIANQFPDVKLRLEKVKESNLNS